MYPICLYINNLFNIEIFQSKIKFIKLEYIIKNNGPKKK